MAKNPLKFEQTPRSLSNPSYRHAVNDNTIFTNVHDSSRFSDSTIKNLLAQGIASSNINYLKTGWDHVEWAIALHADDDRREALLRGLDLFARRQKLLPAEKHLIYPQDANTGESAIEFYARAWKVYAELEVLFQDDIKRLGDLKLVKTIRNMCRSRSCNAEDILPPPKKVRTDMGLAAAPVGSPAHAFYNATVQSRTRMTRNREHAKLRMS